MGTSCPQRRGRDWAPRPRASLEVAPEPGEAPRLAARIVGRHREVETLVELLADADRGGALLTGERGVGRSRLLDAVVTRLREQGLPVRQLPVMRGQTALPAESELAGTDPRPVLVLDDAHLLDQAAASGLHDLAVAGRVGLLLALPTGARPPEPIAALSKDGVCERVGVGPLTREDCADLVADLVGKPVDAATARQVWTLTRGLPRLVVDLVRGLLESDMLVPDGGLWSWERLDELPLAILDDAVGGRLERIATSERYVLDLLACAGPIGPEILVDAGARPEALESLERRGAVLARRSGRRLVVEIPDPLLAMAVRQQIGGVRERHLLTRLTQAWAGRGLRRGDDLARWARLVLDAGATPPADAAERGARQALLGGDYLLAERLARSALESGAGAYAAGCLAAALSSQSRAVEAESALRQADERVAGHLSRPLVVLEGHAATLQQADERVDPGLALVRAANLRWGLSDCETSGRLVRDVLGSSPPARVRATARLTLAGFQLYDGQFAAALSLAEQVVASEPPGTHRWYQALIVSINALYSLGRASAAVDQARRALAALGDDPAAEDSALPRVARHQLAASVARAYLAHGDLDAAEDLAQGCYAGTSGRTLLTTATWASFLGEVALLRGRVRTAVGFLAEAKTAAQRSGVGGLVGRSVRVMVAKNFARALVASGQAEAARRSLGDVEPADLRCLRAIDLWTGDAAGALAAATSQAARGIEIALRTAEQARDLGAWGIYVPALHQAVRLGGAAQVPADALACVCVEGPLLAAQADHVRAAVGGKAGALVAVAERYGELGTYLFAAEAAAEAARLPDTAGERAATRRASALARAYAAHGQDLLPQVIAQLREPTNLTPRQAEIARLAARGLPSKAIARRLVVSVRTVDNCLGQVYRRLGIASRAELRHEMGVLPGDARPMGTRFEVPGNGVAVYSVPRPTAR